MRLPLVLVLIVAGCASGDEPSAASGLTDGAVSSAAIQARLLFVGDVMLGRGVAAGAAADPNDLFAGVRASVRGADLALLNLESPLTTVPQMADNPNDLRADPALAQALAVAGFDVANLANNHSGDAGAAGLVETLDAIEQAGMTPLGVEAGAIHHGTQVLDVGGLSIGLAAFTMVASDAGEAGISMWEPATAEMLVRDLATRSDVVAVSLHGGSERIPVADQAVLDVAGQLVTWGADVVWGHGPHVPHPVFTIERPVREEAIVATSLGNFLFDQHFAPAQTGLILEVMVDTAGVVAWRVGEALHTDLVVAAPEWRLPDGDAVLFGSEWWTPAGIVTADPVRTAELAHFQHGDVVAAAWGDVTGDGADDLVVAYRHPFRETPLNRLYPDRRWADDAGRSAHIGLFTPESDPIWGAGTLANPIDVIAPCDGAIGVEYGSFDGTVAGAGALRWQGFGLVDVPVLPGAGIPGCADVNGDGVHEVVITSRRPAVFGP